jgi:hypothetical protein
MTKTMHHFLRAKRGKEEPIGDEDSHKVDSFNKRFFAFAQNDKSKALT